MGNYKTFFETMARVSNASSSFEQEIIKGGSLTRLVESYEKGNASYAEALEHFAASQQILASLPEENKLVKVGQLVEEIDDLLKEHKGKLDAIPTNLVDKEELVNVDKTRQFIRDYRHHLTLVQYKIQDFSQGLGHGPEQLIEVLSKEKQKTYRLLINHPEAFMMWCLYSLSFGKFALIVAQICHIALSAYQKQVSLEDTATFILDS